MGKGTTVFEHRPGDSVTIGTLGASARDRADSPHECRAVPTRFLIHRES